MRFATPFRRALVATGSIVASCLIASTAMAAPTSSVTESRGYQACHAAASKVGQGSDQPNSLIFRPAEP